MSDVGAVVFDLGGVVFDSPLTAIAEYERAGGLDPGVVNRAVVVGGADGAWSRFERGDISYVVFRDDFANDCRTLGAEVDVDALMRAIDSVLVVRPPMIEAIDRLSASGLSVGALTNNFKPLAGHPLTERFDVVVESSVEGVRKPERRIYEILLDRLSLPAERVVFLDDLGANLKPARAMGMTTIKVDDPNEALEELWKAVNLPG